MALRNHRNRVKQRVHQIASNRNREKHRKCIDKESNSIKTVSNTIDKQLTGIELNMHRLTSVY